MIGILTAVLILAGSIAPPESPYLKECRDNIIISDPGHTTAQQKEQYIEDCAELLRRMHNVEVDRERDGRI